MTRIRFVNGDEISSFAAGVFAEIRAASADAQEAMMAARFIGAPLIIPIHYDTWPAIRQDPQAFKYAIERTTDLRVAVLKPGESLDLDPATIKKRV